MEVLKVQEDYLRTLCGDNAAPPRRLLPLLSVLLPANYLNELLVAKDLVKLELPDLVLDLAPGRVDFPCFVAYREPILFICLDLSFHHHVPIDEDVEEVRT